MNQNGQKKNYRCLRRILAEAQPGRHPPSPGIKRKSIIEETVPKLSLAW